LYTKSIAHLTTTFYSSLSSQTLPNMTPNIVFINDNCALEKTCLIWDKAPVLALDTEFIRTDTFYPIPALLQVYDGQQCYLLDLVALTDFSALAAIFTNKSIIKVLHSCSEDLEVFDGLFKTLPTPLFDTQIAAAFLGYGFSIGYSRLVKNLFDKEPAKDESRSNWLQRPLSASQIEYAALDVIYLYKIYVQFNQQLGESEKRHWMEQSHQEMLGNYLNNQLPEHYFQRIKNAWQLSDEQQIALYQFCLWRELEARRRNKPRNRILSDENLFEHAQRNTLPKGYVEQQQKNAVRPKPDMPLPRETGDLLKQLKSHVDKEAQHLKIAPELLGRKKDLTALVGSGIATKHFQLPPVFMGWRKNIVGNGLLEIANNWKTGRAADSGDAVI
jgi:ribonuclease D